LCAQSIVLATNCSLAHLDPGGRHTSVTLDDANTKLLVIGTYWPSGSWPEAITSRSEMQAQITSLITTYHDCTPLIIGDMNATRSIHDRTSKNMYLADKMHHDFIKVHNFSLLSNQPSDATNPRPWTFSKPTGVDNQGKIYSFSFVGGVLLSSNLAETCKPCYMCDLGYLSDHIPLMGIIPSFYTMKKHRPAKTQNKPPWYVLSAPQISKIYICPLWSLAWHNAKATTSNTKSR